MADQVSEDTGQPVILEQRGELVWGLSTKPVPYGKPVTVLLWLYNPTDKPQPVMTCSDIDFFWLGGIDLFDSSGQRILSIKEQREQSHSSLQSVFVCESNVFFFVPPHSSMHGHFSKLEYVFSRDLRDYYSGLLGRYVIVRSEKDKEGKPVTRIVSNPQNGLRIEITGP